MTAAEFSRAWKVKEEERYLAHAEKGFYVVWLVRKSGNARFKGRIIVVQLQLRGSHVVQTLDFDIQQFLLLLRTNVNWSRTTKELLKPNICRQK